MSRKSIIVLIQYAIVKNFYILETVRAYPNLYFQ
jgi:hypothetical protein